MFEKSSYEPELLSRGIMVFPGVSPEEAQASAGDLLPIIDEAYDLMLKGEKVDSTGPAQDALRQHTLNTSEDPAP